MSVRGLCILAGAMLILAIPTGWPYFFYILLRWFIFIASAIVAYGFYSSKISAWALVFGGIAFLFNPIEPIYLNKSTWVSLDFISAICFFIASGSSRRKL